MPGANEAARDFRGRAAHRFRVERIAAEEIDFLQLREQSRARIAARDALELVHGQRFADIEPVGVELGAAVEVAGDDERVALHALAARRASQSGRPRSTSSTKR